jgi:hypothetical protein
VRSDDERLRLFCDRVARALSRRAVTEGTIAASFNVRWTEDEGLRIDTNLGDDEDVCSLLLEIRKFFSDREDVYFPRIANIVEQVVADAELREANRANRQSWKRALAGVGGIALHADGINYTPERCFDVVVNGELFHDDRDKAIAFERLVPEFRAFVLTSVNSLIIQVLGILHAERALITEAFERGAVAAT